MTIHIAIPEPTSRDLEYNQRSMSQCLAALRAVGSSAIIIPLDEKPDRVARLLEMAQGILLPGSPSDLDPQRYGEEPIPECASPDPARAAVDELLLQDAFNLRKPILAICAGTQALNVWSGGTLVQDLKTSVNHRPGREVVEAHPVLIEPRSRLASLIPQGDLAELQVNSSHHQAIRMPGDNLLVTARSPEDGVIEAVELDSLEHFVLAVQWHPERTMTQKAFSRAIFAAFVDAVKAWQPRHTDEEMVEEPVAR